MTTTDQKTEQQKLDEAAQKYADKIAEDAAAAHFGKINKGAQTLGQQVHEFFIGMFQDPGNAIAKAAEKLGESIGSGILNGVVKRLNGPDDTKRTTSEFQSEYDQGRVSRADAQAQGLDVSKKHADWIRYMHMGSGGQDARASGGSVRAGMSYLVGEKGPELRTFQQDGQITSNEDIRKALMGGDRGEGGDTFHNYFTGPIANEYVARIVSDRIAFEMRRRKMLDPIA